MPKKKEVKFDPFEQITETRKIMSPTTGDCVTVIRGMGMKETKFVLPTNMNGKDFRKWHNEMKELVLKYQNFELKGDINYKPTKNVEDDE